MFMRLVVALLFAGAALLSPSNSAAGEYAPQRGWYVSNWFQGTPWEYARIHPSYEAAFETDYLWYGRRWNGPEKASCSPGDVRFWLYLSSNNFVSDHGTHEDWAEAWYELVECDGSGSSGPWFYPSSATNMYRCADGDWKFPSGFPGDVERCWAEDNQSEDTKNQGQPECREACAGSGINVATGNTYETDSGYAGEGPWPLEFNWTYNS